MLFFCVRKSFDAVWTDSLLYKYLESLGSEVKCIWPLKTYTLLLRRKFFYQVYVSDSFTGYLPLFHAQDIHALLNELFSQTYVDLNSIIPRVVWSHLKSLIQYIIRQWKT